MKQFKSWVAYQTFVDHVIGQYRYHFDDVTVDFLQAVLRTATDRTISLPAGQRLWRAQKSELRELRTLPPISREEDPDFDDEAPSEPLEIVLECLVPFPPERMKPLSGVATEGRVNPKGIPYLYVSDDRDTAMAELRPFKDEILTLAEFATERQLRIVDCCQNIEPPRFDRIMTESHIEKVVWGTISMAFSEPVERKDNTADYAPTQVLGELFRRHGFDGIKYRSGLGNGNNFALFDLDAANVLGECQLYRTTGISWTFCREWQPWEFPAETE